MNKKSASVFLALFLNVLFAGVFLGISFLLKENESATVYMNQIGIYEEESNASESKLKVEALGLTAYTYALDDLFVVVSSVYEEKSLTQSEAELLNANGISFIEKEVTSSSPAFLEAMHAEDIEKLMELMNDQSS